MIFEKISGDAHNPAHVFAALELRREGGWLHRRDSERESPRVTRRRLIMISILSVRRPRTSLCDRPDARFPVGRIAGLD